MLRALRDTFNSPRIMGFKATSLSGACTVNIGKDDVYSKASASAGKSYLTLADVFQRTPVVVGTPVYSAPQASGSLLIDADPTISLLSLKNHDGTNPLDGSFHALVHGHDSQDASFYNYGGSKAPFTVKSSWNSPRFEIFKVLPDASAPSLQVGAGKATLRRNGVGDYTITFLRPFSSDNVIALSCPQIFGYGYKYGMHIVSTSATAVRVIQTDTGTPVEDRAFYVVVKGSDNPQYGGRHRKTARVSDRMPRIIAGHVQYSAGVPSIKVGTGAFTIQDSGVGNLQVDFTDEFERIGAVIVNQNKPGYAYPVSVSTSSFSMTTGDITGAATDPDDIHFMVFGYDDADEYAI